MINNSHSTSRHGLAPATKLTLVQHNSLGSGDVFLSLFSSLTEDPSRADIVLLQDPPSSKGFLPSFQGFKSFAPPIARPRVACYLSLNFLWQFAVLPFFPPESDNFMALDVYTPKGCFGQKFPRFRVSHSYAGPLPPAPYSVSPETALPVFDFPYLVAGDFNIHNAASDPSRLLSSKEEKESAPYLSRASDLGYTLLNTPGIYPPFPFSGNHRPSTIDLAFANPYAFPAFHHGDATTLPSTRSHHAPILFSLHTPSPHNDNPRPRWQEVDWPSLTDQIKGWQVPPPLTLPPPVNSTCGSPRPSPRSRKTIEVTGPRSRPSPKSKAWWTPLLTSLRKEFTKATQRAKELQTPDSYTIARQAKLGYFKSIKRAKASYWADFLAKTSPNNIWTAKQLVAPRKTPRFPSLPDASGPVAINKPLLDHFFPPKDPLPGRGRLYKNPSSPPLTSEKIRLSRSKSSPSSAPGPDGVPYSVWKKDNLINPTIILELLSPLVAFGYHPPSLKAANGVVLDKPGKASYDTPASF